MSDVDISGVLLLPEAISRAMVMFDLKWFVAAHSCSSVDPTVYIEERWRHVNMRKCSICSHIQMHRKLKSIAHEIRQAKRQLGMEMLMYVFFRNVWGQTNIIINWAKHSSHSHIEREKN